MGGSREDRPAMEGLVRFGWIKGVLIRNLLNIWGVMLFLRLSWVIGQAGIIEGVFLILSTTVVTIITALSMSAISTNGLIKGGGTYFMISRALGPEFGASIGLIFSLANAVACAMYTVGFCESLLDLLRTFSYQIVDGGVQDMRIIGCWTLLVLLCIVVIGMEWESKMCFHGSYFNIATTHITIFYNKAIAAMDGTSFMYLNILHHFTYAFAAQMGLLVILLIAIVDFVVGAIWGPQSDISRAKGFIGFNNTVFMNNLMPDFRISQGVDYDFFSVFAVFFPAASGFLAGANISGDLKDPQVAIPKGTILSIILTTASYVSMAVLAGWTVVRDASGNLEEFLNGTNTNCTDRKCLYGLQNSFQARALYSAVEKTKKPVRQC